MNFEAPPSDELLREQDESEHPGSLESESDPALLEIEHAMTEQLERLEAFREALLPRILDYYKAEAIHQFDTPNQPAGAAGVRAMTIYGLVRDNAGRLLRIPHYDDRISAMKSTLEQTWGQTQDGEQTRESTAAELASLESYVNKLGLYTEAVERGEEANLAFMQILSPEEFYEVAATEPPPGTTRVWLGD